MEDLLQSFLITETSKENPFFEARLTKWLRDSDEFQNFAIRNKPSIAKKIRDIQEEEDLWDVFYELEVGYYLTLVPETRVIIYQPKNSSEISSRNPDYFVSFEEEEFYLEVARIRDNQNLERQKFTYEDENGILIDTGAERLIDRTAKIKDIIFSKLTQLVDLKPNVLFILTESPDFDFLSIQRAVYWIGKQIKNRKESYFHDKKWTGSGIEYFLEHWKKLSAIVFKDTFREQSVERIQGATFPISSNLADCLINLRAKGELSKQELIEKRNLLGPEQFAYQYAHQFQTPTK